MALVRLCAVTDLVPGRAAAHVVGDREIALYNVEGVFYATDNECTHAAGSLGHGVLKGDVIRCPVHFGTFRVTDGQALKPPCIVALRTYRVTVEKGEVLVDLDKSPGE